MNKKMPDVVSIGMPVRNGAAFIEEAIEHILNQTHENIEIIISDNNSTDGTFEICKKYATHDDRIKLYRQKKTITVVENFKFVFQNSKSNFFMWAAHDDRRSMNYVENLLRILKKHEDAALAFSEVVTFSGHENYFENKIKDYSFEIEMRSSLQKKIWAALNGGCLECYGLIRTTCLKDYQWHDIDYGPDHPILLHLSLHGSFIKSSHCTFYCYKPTTKKTAKERSRENHYQNLKPFPELRLSRACSKTITSTKKYNHFKYISPLITLYLYAIRRTPIIKRFLYENSPGAVRTVWKKFKYRRVS